MCSFKDSRRLDYELVERKNFPLLPGAWIRMALLWDSESEDEQLKAVQGPDTAILDDPLIRMFDPKRLYYKEWLDHNHINMDYFSERSEARSPLFWKTKPGAEAAIPFANACYYNLVRTTKTMLESNPSLVTSGDLLEFDNEYGDIDIVRAEALLDLLDVAIFFSEDKFVELLLDWGANTNGNSPEGCCKLLFASKFCFWEKMVHRGTNQTKNFQHN